MADYRTLRDEERQAAAYHAGMCVLSVFDDNVLDLLNVGPTVRAYIQKVRAREDDYVGVGVAYFGLMVSNYDLTEQDRLVASQCLAVASSCILDNKVATKLAYDDEDVLTNVNVLSELKAWMNKVDAPTVLTGDALMEQGLSLVTFMEQYNREVLDKSRSFTKGGVNDDESADEDPSFFGWVRGKKS